MCKQMVSKGLYEIDGGRRGYNDDTRENREEKNDEKWKSLWLMEKMWIFVSVWLCNPIILFFIEKSYNSIWYKCFVCCTYIMRVSLELYAEGDGAVHWICVCQCKVDKKCLIMPWISQLHMNNVRRRHFMRYDALMCVSAAANTTELLLHRAYTKR